MGYLNGVHIRKMLKTRTLLAKIWGTVMVVSSGMALGPEGPMIHSGAIIGSALTRVGADTFLTRSSRKIRQNLASSQAICRCS